MGAWVRVAVTAGVLAGAIVLIQLLSGSEAVPLRRSFDEFPLQLGSYRGSERGLEPDILRVLGATDFMMRAYTAPGRLPVWLYMGYYASQRTGATIHSPRNCLPGNGWSIVESRRVAIEAPGRASGITVNRVIVAKGPDRHLVLYWYQQGGRVVASEYWGKAYTAWDAVARARTDGALIRVSAPIAGSVEEAHREVIDFSRQLLALLPAFLPA